MFKYNEYSDLLNGELVVPIKKTPEGVVCLDKDGNQVLHTIDDFDFEKTVEERMFIVEDSSDEEETSSDDTPTEDSSNDSEDIPIDDSSDDIVDDSSDDIIDDSSDDSEDIPIDDSNDEPDNSEEDDSSGEERKFGESEMNAKHWIKDEYTKYMYALKLGYSPKEFRKILLWEE